MNKRFPKFEEMSGFDEITKVSSFTDRAAERVLKAWEYVSFASDMLLEICVRLVVPLVCVAGFVFSCYNVFSSQDVEIISMNLVIVVIFYEFLHIMYYDREVSANEYRSRRGQG